LTALTPDHEGQHTGAGRWAFEAAPLVVGQPAPDSRVRTGLHRPSQTGVNDLAPAAEGLCLLDLEESRSGVADREEQLGVLTQARRAVSPCHLGSGFLDRGLGDLRHVSQLRRLDLRRQGSQPNRWLLSFFMFIFFHLAACEFDASADIKRRAGIHVATRDLSPASTQRLLPWRRQVWTMRRPSRARTLAGAVERTGNA
jgi:hypothetical protein